MGIRSFFGFGQARDKPTNTAGSGYSFLFGRTTSGKPVNERTAMQTTAVYACVRILAETVASLPLHVYEYKDGGKELVHDHPLYYLLHDEPNPEMTSFVFRETLMGHLLIWGNAYAQIVRDGSGRVLGRYPLLPNKMNVDGLLRGDYQSRMNGYATGRQNGWFSANDIREMENMNPISDEEGGNLYLINGAMTKLADAGMFAGDGQTEETGQEPPAQNERKRGKR